MARRNRNEPMWPLVLIVGLVAGGLALGGFIGDRSDDGADALDAPSDRPVDEGIPAPGNRIRVEVLNGAGVPGVAGVARDQLREQGFDVVYFGNATSFDYDTSVVFDRGGTDDAASAVGRSIGIGTVRVEPDTTRLVDVTVVLGADWQADPGLRPAMPEEPEPLENARAWWDPRRFVWRGR